MSLTDRNVVNVVLFNETGVSSSLDPSTGRFVVTGSVSVVGAVSNQPTIKSSYAAMVTNITPPATPTDVATMVGSSTKKVIVQRITLTTTQTTTGINTWFLAVRSSANSGGTSTNMVVVPFDRQYPVATAVPKSWTANATALGTLLGNISIVRICAPTLTSLINPTYVWDLTNAGLLAGLVLRSASEQLSINFNAVALPTGMNVSFGFEWTEE